jgi:hypothetical protein
VTGPRRAFVIVVAALAALGAVALVAQMAAAPAARTETGVVIAVDGSSLTDVTGFTLRTADGRSVPFRIGELQNAAVFPPGHLSEHMATSSPIVVTYREQDGDRVAVRLEDAPASSSRPPEGS